MPSSRTFLSGEDGKKHRIEIHRTERAALIQQNIFGFQVPVRPVAFEKFQRQAVELSGQVAEVRFVAGAGAPHNGFVERDSFDPVVHDHVAPLALPVGLPNVKLLPQEFLLIDRFEVLHRPCVAFGILYRLPQRILKTTALLPTQRRGSPSEERHTSISPSVRVSP